MHIARTQAARDRVLCFDNVFGAGMVDGLLEHVDRNKDSFVPARVYQRTTAALTVDTVTRDCLKSRHLGPFRARLSAAIAERALDAASALGLLEPDIEPVEYEICAYGNGGQFTAHMDVLPPPARTRVMTCVYYFSTSPRRFSGGDLRVFSWPGASDQHPIDIAPESDRLVILPSFLKHQVMPVTLDGDVWMDRRFNLTCWLCRPSVESAL